MKTPASPLAALTDGQLAASAKTEDEAFKVLVLRHSPHLKIYLCKLLHGNRVLAEDALQITWMHAFDRLRKGAYHENGLFFKWLNKIVFNVAMKMRKEEKPYVHDTEEETEEPLVELPEGPDDDELQVYEVFKKMHPAMKRAVYLRTKMRMTCSEIAEKMHTSPNTVSKTLHRAYIMIREAVKKMKMKKNLQASAVKNDPNGIV